MNEKWYERPGNRKELLERIEALEKELKETRELLRRVALNEQPWKGATPEQREGKEKA